MDIEAKRQEIADRMGLAHLLIHPVYLSTIGRGGIALGFELLTDDDHYLVWSVTGVAVCKESSREAAIRKLWEFELRRIATTNLGGT